MHTSPKQISTWKSLSKTIRYNETPCKGSPKFGSHPLRDAEVEGGRTDRKLRAWCKQRKRPCVTDSCLMGLRQRTLWAMRQGSTWRRWTRHGSWVPCLAPLRSQEVCHIGPHQESHKSPCRSCPPNRTCRSRQSAHPYSSVGFASKCMRHPWEGTIHQHTAIWADHRRRTARPVRDCAAIASLVAPCHSGAIQVRTARDCNHHQSCDAQHAMSSAEAAQAMFKEIQLSLGPDAGPNDSTQVGEAARAREARSRYRPDESRRRTQKGLQQGRKAKQEGAGFWATPQGRRLTAPMKGSQYRTAPKLGKIGTGCGTIEGLLRQHQNVRAAGPGTHSKPGTRKGKTGSDRPSSSQDWRHDWQWEGDRDRTPKTLLHRIQLVGASRRAQTMSRGAGQRFDVARRGCRPAALPRRRLPWQESGPLQPKRKVVEKWSPLARSYTKPTRRAPQTFSETFLEEEISKNSTPASIYRPGSSQVPSCGNWTLSFPIF